MSSLKSNMFFPGGRPWRASPTVVSVEEAIAALRRAGYATFPTDRVEQLELYTEISKLMEEQRLPGFEEYQARYLTSAMANYAANAIRDKIVSIVSMVDERGRFTRYISKVSLICATKEELESDRRERERLEPEQPWHWGYFE